VEPQTTDSVVRGAGERIL